MLNVKRAIWLVPLVVALSLGACATPTAAPTPAPVPVVEKTVVVTVVVTATPTPQPPATPKPAGAACESLKTLALAETTITLAESREATAFTPPGTTTVLTPTVAFCRVAGVIVPEIRFEVWLPTAASWNGKFNGVGNGGLAGSIGYAAMNTALSRNYATASTDTGHVGGNGGFALGRPELLVDFASRAIHVTALAAKSIVQSYYGKGPQYSYFTGCSGGGGQALSEAQRYPNDYNGIVAGAPANFVTRMWPGELWPAWYTHKDAASLIPVEKLPMINKAAVAACDEQDNVKDGLIQDPRRCNFDPAKLQCTGADGPDCLTAAQVLSVKAVYGGLKDPTTGKQFWPGYEPGSELGWAGHIGVPFNIPLSYFKYMALLDTSWNWQTFDFTDPKNMAVLYSADVRLAPILNSTDPDLGTFKSAGGKLIMYHGWNDQNISPRNSIAYYQSVVDVMGGEKPTQDFLRLFMLPGMGHCSGGAGPNTFDSLAALEQWVEKGTAPVQILASHLTAGQVDRTRPLCVYPQVETYKGSGSIDDAANFSCASPK